MSSRKSATNLSWLVNSSFPDLPSSDSSSSALIVHNGNQPIVIEDDVKPISDSDRPKRRRSRERDKRKGKKEKKDGKRKHEKKKRRKEEDSKERKKEHVLTDKEKILMIERNIATTGTLPIAYPFSSSSSSTSSYGIRIPATTSTSLLPIVEAADNTRLSK
jgi:hypothetical protein